MINCFTHTFPGETIKLVKDPPEEDDFQLAADAIASIQEFDSFIQPLIADLIVRYRDGDWLPVDKIKPPLPHWHLRTSSIPAGVSAMSEITNPEPQISEKPHLSGEVMFDWIQMALNQECPNSEMSKITWSEISIESTQARILDLDKEKIEPEQFLSLNSDIGYLNLPIESRANGFWISGPPSQLPGEPPFTFRLTQQYGGLSLSIHLHYSLWTAENSPGNKAMKSAILRLINRGWEIYYLSPAMGWKDLPCGNI
jgi:hypothetical protein